MAGMKQYVRILRRGGRSERRGSLAVIKIINIFLENMTNEMYNKIKHSGYVFLKGVNTMENERIGARIKQLRKESKITQEQMASYLKVDQSMVTKLENGTRSLNVTLIDKICNLFGCSQAYLLGEDDSYIPLNFAFRSNGVQAEDLESIAAVNRIVMNIRMMNELVED